MGEIPAKVSLKDRAILTAGFAKLVEDVNQYAPVIYIPTIAGITLGEWKRLPNITNIKPNVAKTSEHQRLIPDLLV